MEFIVETNFIPDVEAAKLAGFPEIVRCKDCKYWSDRTILEYHICTRYSRYIKNFATSWNWFCADGEPKER